MIAPGAEAVIKLLVDELIDEANDRVPFGKRLVLYEIVIIRHSYVSGIADKINNVSVLREEGLVALQYSGSGKHAKAGIGIYVNGGNPLLYVEKCNGLIRTNEVTDEESKPSISGSGVRD